jgi:hypothetical protein
MKKRRMKACRYTQVGKIVNSYNALKQLSKHFIVVFDLYLKNFCELRWYTVHFCYEIKTLCKLYWARLYRARTRKFKPWI